MAPERIQLLYDKTIGAVAKSKTNPLWNMSITSQGASKFANLDLGLNLAVAGDRETQSEIRAAVRKYIRPMLRDGETLRCLLGVSGNPRVNICLLRRSGQIGVEFENTDVVSLVQYWCKRANCALH